MSRRSIKKIIGDKDAAMDINAMFEEMMGIKDADPDIVLPKFVAVKNQIRSIYRILSMFANGCIKSDFPWTSDALEEIAQFTNALKLNIPFNPIADETDVAYQQLTKEELNNKYRELKENKYIKQLIIMCNKLRRFDVYLKDELSLQDNFIGQEPGLSMQIFDFSTLDLKKLWIDPATTTSVKKYVLIVLHKLYIKSQDLFKTITSPDIDVNKFSELLISSIDHLKTQPELSRCKNAFRKIEESVNLLNNKFGQYYRESIASANPSIIMENFILDVSNQGHMSSKLTFEFKIIIGYMRKLSQKNGKANDPRIKKMFSILDQNYKAMEEYTPKQSNVNNSATGGADAAVDADGATDAAAVDADGATDAAADEVDATDDTTPITSNDVIASLIKDPNTQSLDDC